MIREYTDNDYEMVCDWLQAKDIPRPDKNFFSSIGCVADNAAVGFLFTTNSKICYLDNIAANPNVSSHLRSEAINKVICELQNKAKELGFEFAIVLADLPAMKSRFLSHGFTAFKNMTVFNRRFSCLG